MPVEDVFILSAGWGLVRADFLLPAYNITFSPQGPKHIHRGGKDPTWRDFNQLVGTIKSGEEVHFFGGQDYLRPFCRLVSSHDSPQDFVIHHKVDDSKVALPEGFRTCRHTIRDRMWHYKALTDFLAP